MTSKQGWFATSEDWMDEGRITAETAETAVTAEALEPMRHRLQAFCYQMLGSPFDAEDAVQDVMERAWRSRARIVPSRQQMARW